MPFWKVREAFSSAGKRLHLVQVPNCRCRLTLKSLANFYFKSNYKKIVMEVKLFSVRIDLGIDLGKVLAGIPMTP